jgi:hypothetical protein
MPAFTFEKISPEKTSKQARRGAASDAEKKPRGVMSRVLDRLAVLRVRRRLRDDDGSIARREKNVRD